MKLQTISSGWYILNHRKFQISLVIEYKLMEVSKMPWNDETGPAGQGPLTGRGMGACGGGQGFRRGNFGRGFRRGAGRGFRQGFGWKGWNLPWNWNNVPVEQQPVQPTKEQEMNILESETIALENEQKLIKQEIDVIKKRLGELKNSKD
jgi:hypothetical protein